MWTTNSNIAENEAYKRLDDITDWWSLQLVYLRTFA